MTSQPWPAPAKINHFLHVTGRRDDGYHLLQTVFQFLDLADELWIAATGDGRIRRQGNYRQVDEQNDLVVRAAKLLFIRELSGSSGGAEIRVDKKIPIGWGPRRRKLRRGDDPGGPELPVGHGSDNGPTRRSRAEPGRRRAGIRARLRRLGRRRRRETGTGGTAGRLVPGGLSRRARRHRRNFPTRRT